MATTVPELEHLGPTSFTRGGPRKGDVVAGRYVLIREIARGGMGVVFEARHAFTKRSLALKFVPSDIVQQELGRKRLEQEARALGVCRHPGIVDIWDAGVSSEVGPYIAMEFLEGRTLDGILGARRVLSIPETMAVAKSIGLALGHAHARGVVHRDVKPSNIFLLRGADGSEQLKLIDFGIAGNVTDEALGPHSTRLTKAGDMLGTLDYLAPEQLARPDIADPRSDQCSLATVLFECLTGAVPPISERLGGPAKLPNLAVQHPNIPPRIVAAIQRAMAPKVTDRFPDMGAFLGAMFESAPGPTGLLPTVNAGAPPSAQSGQHPKPNAAPNGVSRRRYQRAPYITPCRVLCEDGTNIDGRSEDISEGGLLLILPHYMRSRAEQQSGQTETVKIRFSLPTTGAIATVSGTVRWLKDGSGRAALGIEFESPSDEVRSSISTYVRLVGTGS